jgi:hypothetical protein
MNKMCENMYRDLVWDSYRFSLDSNGRVYFRIGKRSTWLWWERNSEYQQFVKQWCIVRI